MVLTAGIVLGKCVVVCEWPGKQNPPYIWYALVGIFLFLSIDEGASIHELLMDPVKNALNITSGFLYYGWFLVYGVVVVALALAFLRFYLRLSRQMKVLMFLAAVLYLAGAIGMGALGGSLASSLDSETWRTYSLISITEETLELLGVTTLIYASLVNLRANKYIEKIQF